MPAQDTTQIKEKIISILRLNGPSLPVHLAKGVNLSTLFASAFLSELISEKRIQMSHMRVGSSPLYFIQGQEHLLERFSIHLKSKEKEAFLLLKEKKFLEDAKQEPAIRVALREIKDFAIPFYKENEIIWRFLTIQEFDFLKEKKPEIIGKEKPLEKEIAPKEEIIGKDKIIEKEGETLNIFDSLEKIKIKKSKLKKSTKKITKKSSKKDESFFNKVKEYLSEKSIEIIDLLSFGKNELVIKIKEKHIEEEKILIAYNKKKVNENDVIRAAKKSLEFNLPYIILSQSEPLKKVSELISAAKNLHSFEKLK